MYREYQINAPTTKNTAVPTANGIKKTYPVKDDFCVNGVLFLYVWCTHLVFISTLFFCTPTQGALTTHLLSFFFTFMYYTHHWYRGSGWPLWCPSSKSEGEGRTDENNIYTCPSKNRTPSLICGLSLKSTIFPPLSPRQQGTPQK